MALAEAVGKGTLPQLEALVLKYNSTISQQAKDALCEDRPSAVSLSLSLSLSRVAVPIARVNHAGRCLAVCRCL